MSEGHAARFASATRAPIWFEALDASPLSALDGDCRADLAIVGGGYTGLWTALKARERWPEASIVVLEAGRCGEAASGRNGGFCAPSISHGVGNAIARWPREAETLVRLGRENLDGLEDDLEAYGIACDFQRPGKLTLAATDWQVAGLRALQQAHARFGIESTWLEGDALAERLRSPAYGAALFEANYALLHPGRLVAGLREAARRNGVEVFEATEVQAIKRKGRDLVLTTSAGRVEARRVVLATNAAVPLLRRLHRSIVPIFDYTLVTEPLSDAQLREVGWTSAHGIADSGNRFHYSRKTADNRILWGGYDAIYHRGSRRDPALLHRPESLERLAANFDRVFPALSDVRFDHAWGGIIDTSARTTFFVGTAHSGQVAYAMGFTGQGVSATRFAALSLLDLLEGSPTERTRLAMTSRRPVAFPPEPLRHAAIAMAQRDLAREDETGRRSWLLRLMDRFGVGFDS